MRCASVSARRRVAEMAIKTALVHGQAYEFGASDFKCRLAGRGGRKRMTAGGGGAKGRRHYGTGKEPG